MNTSGAEFASASEAWMVNSEHALTVAEKGILPTHEIHKQTHVTQMFCHSKYYCAIDLRISVCLRTCAADHAVAQSGDSDSVRR